MGTSAVIYRNNPKNKNVFEGILVKSDGYLNYTGLILSRNFKTVADTNEMFRIMNRKRNNYLACLVSPFLYEGKHSFNEVLSYYKSYEQVHLSRSETVLLGYKDNTVFLKQFSAVPKDRLNDETSFAYYQTSSGTWYVQFYVVDHKRKNYLVNLSILKALNLVNKKVIDAYGYINLEGDSKEVLNRIKIVSDLLKSSNNLQKDKYLKDNKK